MIQNWLRTVEQAFGIKPVIYTRQNFIEGLLGDGVQELEDYPLWIAHYDVQQPSVPASWTSWNFWQYTETGSVQGVNGNVDRDKFNGSLGDLQARGKS
jgi:lysozyme